MSLETTFNDAVTKHFLDTDKFAELVTWYPGSDWYNPQANVKANVDRDAYPGTNETAGDGVIQERDDGRTNRKSVKIDLDASYLTSTPGLQRVQDRMKPDIFVDAAGAIYKGVRTMGEDFGMVTIVCVTTTEVRHTKASKSG